MRLGVAAIVSPAFLLASLPLPAMQGEEGEDYGGALGGGGGGLAGGAGRERYHPGRIVWARVEGHEFWPARVVRRRAGEA